MWLITFLIFFAIFYIVCCYYIFLYFCLHFCQYCTIILINELSQKQSKGSLIIWPKMCNVTDYVTNYNFCHVNLDSVMDYNFKVIYPTLVFCITDVNGFQNNIVAHWEIVRSELIEFKFLFLYMCILPYIVCLSYRWLAPIYRAGGHTHIADPALRVSPESVDTEVN